MRQLSVDKISLDGYGIMEHIGRGPEVGLELRGITIEGLFDCVANRLGRRIVVAGGNG